MSWWADPVEARLWARFVVQLSAADTEDGVAVGTVSTDAARSGASVVDVVVTDVAGGGTGLVVDVWNVGGRAGVPTAAVGAGLGASLAAGERLAGVAQAAMPTTITTNRAVVYAGKARAVGFLHIEAVIEHHRYTGAHFRKPTYRARVGVLVAGLAMLSGCGSAGRPRAAPPTSTLTAPATTIPPTVVTTTVAPTTTAGPTTTTAVTFSYSIDTVTAGSLPHTWRPGCPVGPDQLRMIHLTYWGFDGQAHPGAIVVNAAVVNAVVTIFKTLYNERFPIFEMVPQDAYNGDDNAAAAADDTSGFNCRYAVAPGPPSWSVHAFGEAIDVNDVQNPYIDGTTVIPPEGVAYGNRADVRPGMAVPGGQLVAAFASVGWQWGGRWTASPDYQHFSATGG
jgi:hypothetical protein